MDEEHWVFELEQLLERMRPLQKQQRKIKRPAPHEVSDRVWSLGGDFAGLRRDCELDP